MPKPFDWNDLRFFLAVARSGTISLAGRRTGTDHATVGRRISALEAALGVQLFERNPRGYNLTRHGERLLATAAAMEREAERLEEELAGQNQGLTGTLRISTLEGFGNFFLAPRIGRFAAAHQRLSVELITIQQILALSRREADIAVTLAPPASGRFLHEHLTDYRLFIYGSREYLESHPPIRGREDLARHPFAGYVDDLIFTRGLDYLSEIVPGLRARLQNSSLHAQMEAAVSGFGLCVLPAFIANTRPELQRVLPEEISLLRSYWMVVHADVAELAHVRLARRFIREEALAAASLFMGMTEG
ncbi:LysR family transcriptional regulator [Roseomonas marmotae]|uniref:LysR family transcriptional regulator n=1 Tax=Roseomonas marmotae TaxID=2768161 RepID=A0ABS3KCI9_9PROT|nr:LysR family transcriptional regulator [Roseomonas marmotae]MBO1075181.1 LysR family transcriptional regulator [Roseomonas marmotae]QTI79710.1 LysR family transcriptional regulator [Roseomonas marmotae]